MVEKVTYECRATGESTFQLFKRLHAAVNKKEADVQLLILHVKAFVNYGHVPCYVIAFYRDIY